MRLSTLSRLPFRPRAPLAPQRPDRLSEFCPAISNPGDLRALVHVPDGLPSGSPLVVALHGCTQSAEIYDRGTGWSDLADRYGFAVLFVEQRRANNSNLCFNWFRPGDKRRGEGEAGSIRQLIAALVAERRLDPRRVFITGLSAGGAMTSVMLALYPETFAGGAIIAGLPFGAASNVPQALERMRGTGIDTPAIRDAIVRASPHSGPWPRISVWHGLADQTVVPANASMIVEQWRTAHRAGDAERSRRGTTFTRREWKDRGGRVVIEEYLVDGLGHGVPLAADAREAVGEVGPHMLEAGISSTLEIATSWGLVGERRATPTKSVPLAASVPPPARSPGFGRIDPARVIQDALRAAGLLKSTG